MEKLDYEQNVEFHIKGILDITGSDAQGIILGKQKVLDECFRIGYNSYQCAMEILEQSTTAPIEWTYDQ